MKPPAPEPVDPARLPELALACMKAAKFPFLATSDGSQPRVRPVSPVRTDGFTVYIANLRRYHKTAEIAANPQVELCWLDERHDQVRITGTAAPVTEPDVLASLWAENPLLRRYLGSADNPDMVIYRITPDRVRFMREWALDYHEVPLA